MTRVAFPVVLLLSFLLFLPCCAPLPVSPQSIADAEPDGVVGCVSLGIVRGYSDMGNLSHGQGLQRARNAARIDAARLGADHIVWRPIPDVYAPYISADTYRCKSTSTSSDNVSRTP
ncbi:hypothetical protein [Desulfovibrio inopinatus]|uniref:hypothetical protein n=1 Tax=Desulfovibrio inopinatus TaxID=102109 RepID=UPI0004025FAC|nr:hypothetical protein [Desulfovibrio inopinatus]